MHSVARIGRSGWQDQEISQLKKAVQLAGGKGEPLRSVFDNIGQALGRKPNSVRNFYYASLKREEAGDVPTAAPFETFARDEVRSLVREVLTARAKGVSVRACVQALAGGDRKLMLRYQNKYRSVLKSKPHLIREIIEEMAAGGEAVFDPYAVHTLQTKPLHENITSTIVNSGDPALLGLLRGLDTLLSRRDDGYGAAEGRVRAACAIREKFSGAADGGAREGACGFLQDDQRADWGVGKRDGDVGARSKRHFCGGA